jgi:transcription elongation factor Elf1
MAFIITCDFCEENSHIEFEKDNIFIVCDNCGQEREIIKYDGE